MENKFELESCYDLSGDQEKAVKKLVEGILQNKKSQTLLGVTGSGKTFTIANLIEKINKPTIILSHNKTLAAQLYGEFKSFFPKNLVEYYVSYYDYYQPEAYIPTSGKYIEKDLSINSDLEKMRLKSVISLLSKRKDIIIVSSVSCIYGAGNPVEFSKSVLNIKKGDKYSLKDFSMSMIGMLYNRDDKEFKKGSFRIKGDSIDINPPYKNYAYKLTFWDKEIEEIIAFDIESGRRIYGMSSIEIFPTNLFKTTFNCIKNAINKIEKELEDRCNFFLKEKKFEEETRIKNKTLLDIEMMKEIGYCSGVENYSMYLDDRSINDRPFCLIDYFPKDHLIIIDESHVSIPQIRAMSGGDRARKENLIKYGFRLPSAIANRPLKFEEFKDVINQVVYVSATPGDYEIQDSKNEIIEQIIRPTGLLDPTIEVKSKENQIDDLIKEINFCKEKNSRVLVTTLTKKMAEELNKYFLNINIKSQYIHSEIKTIERIDILQNLRIGKIDVLIGVNLLREGLDLPEVELIVILDADKEGFLRNEKSLIQTIGRAARNLKGRVIMYAEKITESMKKAIFETNRRRKIQENFNKENNINPKGLNKKISNALKEQNPKEYKLDSNEIIEKISFEDLKNMNIQDLKNEKILIEKQMKEQAKKLNFNKAGQLRDRIFFIEELLNK
jgi:excinuclease ABC subunit B